LHAGLSLRSRMRTPMTRRATAPMTGTREQPGRG
jgi:hypothetical protein